MPSAPVPPQQRINYLDVIRGIAISGVLLAYVFWNLGNAPEDTYTSFDKTLDRIFSFLVDSKCYTLLANLFAIGFVLHMNKAQDHRSSLYTYRRRLLGLIGIGLVHALLLRNGDILVPYAVLSLLLTLFYRASNQVIVIAMAIVFFIQVLIPEAWTAFHWAVPQRPAGNGSYLIDNFHWVKYWYVTAPFFWESTLFFLFSGLLVGRFFIEKKKRLTSYQLVTITVLGSFIGSITYWIFISYNTSISSLPDIGNTHVLRTTLKNLLFLLHRVGMASAYACVVYALMKFSSFTTFAALGRTSLSNYILQAVIIVPLCIALNLFDHITPVIALVITVAVWIVQVVWSRLWLSRHRFGPLEWALRRFTYGRKMIDKKSLEKTKPGSNIPAEVPEAL